MKRFMVVLAVAAVGIALAVAHAQVYSVNAVGYVKTTLNPGLNLVRDDFVTIDKSDAKPSKIIGEQLPVDSVVYKWNGSSYDKAFYEVKPPEEPGDPEVVAWNEPAGLTLDPGYGFWVKIPDGSQPVTLTLMGEVPNNPTNTTPVVEGLNLVGYAYPVDKKWGDTDLCKKGKVGDIVYVWNGGGYDKIFFEVTPPEEPGDPEVQAWTDTNYVIRVGQGFWYKREAGGGDTSWIEKRPYDL